MKIPTPRTDAAYTANIRLYSQSLTTNDVVSADFARQLETEIHELHTKDSVRTKEHNILTQENRALLTDRDNLLKLLGKTFGIISEHGQIIEGRIGWLMTEIDCVLGKHGHPSKGIYKTAASAEPANDIAEPRGPQNT